MRVASSVEEVAAGLNIPADNISTELQDFSVIRGYSFIEG